MNSDPSRQFCLGAILALAVAIIGCSEPADMAPSAVLAPPPAVAENAVAAGATPATPSINATPSVASADDAKDAGASSSIAEDNEPKPTVAVYTPPFPDRVDLFVPPKRQGGMVLKEGESEDAVELLGFIRLDRQQVVLSVNGQVTPISEGASQYGIEVISIQPPKVVLQRGRQRWQASLEN